MELILKELMVLRGACVRLLGSFTFLLLAFMATPIAQSVIVRMQGDLVPQGVALVGLTPFDPFLAQATVAAALAMLLVGPLLLIEVWRYVSPGLYPDERRALGQLLWWGSALFVLGTWFSYAFIIPATFAGLYAFTPAGLQSFFSLRDLVSLVCGMTVATGFLFELPVMMMVLVRIGLLSHSFWGRYWRHAVLITVAVSAVVTPDGSGISMMLLSLPVCALYGAGWVGSGVMARHRAELLTNAH